MQPWEARRASQEFAARLAQQAQDMPEGTPGVSGRHSSISSISSEARREARRTSTLSSAAKRNPTSPDWATSRYVMDPSATAGVAAQDPELVQKFVKHGDLSLIHI